MSLIKNWYHQYPDIKTFLIHKLTHVFAGFTIGILCALDNAVVLGFLVVFLLAVIKELIDHEKDGEPLYSMVLDIIITVFGCLIGSLLVGL